jgi:hypothetical protein
MTVLKKVPENVKNDVTPRNILVDSFYLISMNTYFTSPVDSGSSLVMNENPCDVTKC